MSHSSSQASAHFPARSSVRRKDFAKSTGSAVGCFPCCGQVGSRSWILNHVAFRCNLTTFGLTRCCFLLFQTQALTCCLPCCQLSSIHQRTAWHWDKTAGRSIMSTHGFWDIILYYYNLYWCPCVIYYHPYRFFNTFALCIFFSSDAVNLIYM